MGTRTVTYITCDKCGAESPAPYYCANQIMIKMAAKNLGFSITSKNEFCSEKCKADFKKIN